MIMDNANISSLWRGYADVLLEEIALEGLDGITLELLWKRLHVNPEWVLPIDEFVEEFIWKILILLDHVDWFELKNARPTPPVFATSEEYMEAVNKNAVDVFTISSTFYPQKLINDGIVLGSCSSYYDRINVTDQVRLISLNDVKIRFGNKLVLVASQALRNFVLIKHDVNPSFELSDVSYCLLERIGRSRRIGELSLALNFMKNGANPTYYFWNKLRRRKIIRTQGVTIMRNDGVASSSGTLIHLSRFYKVLTSEFSNIILQLCNKILSHPSKMCLFSEAKDLMALSSSKKLHKCDTFRRFIKTTFLPYEDFFPDAHESDLRHKNGVKKLVRVLTVNKENYEEFMQGGADEETTNGRINEIGILEERTVKKPYVVQCYHLIREARAEGLSMVDIQQKLGVTKLFARLLLKLLQKHEFIVNVSSDDARKRFFKYYSKDFYDIVKSNIEKHVSNFSESRDTSAIEDINSTGNLVPIDSNEDAPPETDKVCSDLISDENNEIDTTAKRQSSTDIAKLEEVDVKRRKLDSSPPQDSLQNQLFSILSGTIECSIPATESIFVMRRLNIVMNYIYKVEVTQRYILPKVIVDEETKRGLRQGIPARNSLIKVVNILSDSGKIKVIQRTVCNKALNKSRLLEFLCVPSVSENHPIIQSTVQETLASLSVVYLKYSSKISENSKKPTYSPMKISNKYGFAAKFVRMKTLHELVTYLAYQYEGSENLDLEKCKTFVQPLLRDSESADDLPTFYKKEIGWKMFIPPLMSYEEFGDGWVSQNDIAERLPVKLFFSLVRLPYDHPDINEYLRHPIKQYYLMRHLPQHLQEFLTVDKKYLYSLCLNFRLLCYVGLCQFGPKNKCRGQNWIYLNKKTQLLDTRLSAPGYSKVSSNIEYPVSQYDFTHRGNLEAFWNDALRFSIGTKLGRKKHLEESKKLVHPNRIPQRLTVVAEARSFDEVLRNDNGEVPGDRLGAAGFDSWMFAHKLSLWFRSKSDNKRVEAQASSKLGKLPKGPVKPVSKLMRFRHQVFRKRERNRPIYDKIDLEALNRMRTLRAKWSKSEDEILLMCHLASKYYTKPTILSVYRPYLLFRKILHKSSEKSLDKTVHACKRRVVNLLKNTLKQHSIHLYLKEMAADIELKNKFQAIFKRIEKHSEARNSAKTRMLLDQLTEEVFYHLYSTKKISVFSRGTVEICLPKNVENFHETFNYEYATPKESQKYLELTNKKDLAVLMIVNLIFSALLSQVDKTKTLDVGFLYGIFRQFEDSYLKSALHYVRINRLISNNKSVNRNRGLLLPMGSGVFHLSLTYHLILKPVYRPELFSIVYNKILEMVSSENIENNETFNISNFDAGLSVILLSQFARDNVRFQVEVPDNLLQFNEAPIVIDDSQTKPSVKEKVISATTLSLVCDTFTEQKNNNKLDSAVDECDDDMDVDYPLVDDGEEDDDEDDGLIDFSVSKISIYVTRNQFKHSDVRFSNAYDHFMLNTFTTNYCFIEKKLTSFDCGNRKSFLDQLEKTVNFKKIRFTADEISQKVRAYFHSSAERDFASNLLEFLLIKGVCGVASSDLKTEYEDVQLLKRVVNLMVRRKLILRDGSTDTRFVHINFGEYWLVRSRKKKNIFSDEFGISTSSAAAVNRRFSNDEFKVAENNKPLWLAIRPWVHINGTINDAALDSLLTRVLSCLTKLPGLSLIGVQKKLLPALQPHCTRELLEFLERLKCIKSYIFAKKTQASLFSESMGYKFDDEVHGFEDEDTIIYEPDVHAFVTFSTFLSSAKIKDLLETKYSVDVSSTIDQPCKIERKDIAEDSS